jgi:hypothetical protein
MITMKLIKLAAIPAIALTAGLGLTACSSLKNAPAVTHTAAALTPTATPAPTTPAPTTPAPAKTVYVPVQAPAQNVYVPVQAAPPALTNCGGGVYAGADTSCPFALNVAADYTGAGADYASSPVTGLSYTMNCDGGDGALDTVTCTGGDNALVEFTG